MMKLQLLYNMLTGKICASIRFGRMRSDSMLSAKKLILPMTTKNQKEICAICYDTLSVASASSQNFVSFYKWSPFLSKLQTWSSFIKSAKLLTNVSFVNLNIIFCICIVCFLQLGQADRFPYNLVNVSWCIYYCLYISNHREWNFNSKRIIL